MRDPTSRQSEFNASSRDQWDGFTGHRRKVTELLSDCAGAEGRRLCVLGAGNGNDLDLVALLKTYRDVHLVDLDGRALDLGVRRQGVTGQTGIKTFGGVDLTGMIDVFASWTSQSPIGAEELTALGETPARLVAPALSGPYDVVASTCLLSQLIGNAFHAVGERHPRFLDLVQAIRVGHLRLLTELVAPGGTAVLVTDIVSSDTFPTLGALDESALPGLVPRLAVERNFFHGVNPAVIWSVLRQDPVLKERVIGLEAIPPWRWTLHGRVYLVVAIKYRVA